MTVSPVSTVRTRLQAAAVAVAVVLVGAGGGLLGLQLGDAASAPDVERVSVLAPDAVAGPPADVARSPGGFTGFGGPPALRGEVQRSAPVLSEEAGALVVGTAESSVTVRFSSPARRFRIVPAGVPLRPGDLVQVRVQDGRAVGVLRLPPGLEEGGNRAR